MKEKIYFNLLILFAILYEEITGTFAEEENKTTSDLLIREKRLIDNTPSGNQPVKLKDFPYIVQIAIDGKMKCAGSILLPDLIITCAHCVERGALSAHRVLSNSGRVDRGISHTIVRKIESPGGYARYQYWDDLVLLVISPPIDIINSPNRNIELYKGPDPEYQEGSVVGWGCNRVIQDHNQYPSSLRSITVPIISLNECQRFYRQRYKVTDKNICTFDNHRKKSCGDGDSGSPLVVRGRLLGVHGWNAKDEGNNPDVYMSMLNVEYRNWIISTIREHLRNANSHPSPSNSRDRQKKQMFCCRR